ncbi:molecular chaperone DnaJ [Haematospirillum jordaniae]|uniref:Chaperone protein DnaJ n=1 Tax=Haematospirillum jordaniae TaxID=1549855 RepID=A0A143DCU2_9PROT|nr:molecular chaperone DnaJ [Haematospirillum jordaniae]AMW34537.1 molecular chaperone DnaJ [Haematospirillum jordaniae]NKD44898.1 molecular chaperone DnaJ [Haematospirillum jordaniae]NKD57923.1 molecular chaperone DnaJ [Haematospirillum jordaniae]NKD59965.1 molecular chaperone DnaJ [Haematospirillum jordaniae]NKD67903.1 molecular chaperone DnaJ [Haematospirillum jordaniae]
MSSKRDYYEVLGVSQDADAGAIKKAYRLRAKDCHPDLFPGDDKAAESFRELTEAYEVLQDTQKRAAYDRFGHDAFSQGGGGASGFGGFDFGGGFADIIDEVFGNFAGRQRGGPSRGADVRYDMSITLEEAFLGKTATVTLSTATSCGTCKGSGAKPGTTPTTCSTCRGQGRIRVQQGMFLVERTCSSCHGRGKTITDPCSSCRGSGRENRERTLEVKIPPGVEDGTRIRLSGEGEAGMLGAPAGDLYIFLSIRPHRIFQREGADIYCRVPITMTTAALGGSIEVPSIDGSRARVTIPAGTQSGNQFRLRNKGMSVLRSPKRGDMIVHAQVETPVNLTDEQKDLLRRFDEAGGGETSPESTGFFRRIRELWDDLTD